jgi:hypothetical protein
MKNGSTSKRQFWSDVKKDTVREMTEYEFITSKTNYDQTKTLLSFLNDHSKNGVGSVSQIIKRWEEESIHTILYALCRYDFHPKHWNNLIEEMKNRSDKSSLKPLLEKYELLWGEKATTPRNRKRSLTNNELKDQTRHAQKELDEFVEMFDGEIKEKQDQIQRVEEQLEAEVNELEGIEFEKELVLKDINGNPDELGWYKLDEFRRVKDQLLNHFQKNSLPLNNLSIKDKIKALSKS